MNVYYTLDELVYIRKRKTIKHLSQQIVCMAGPVRLNWPGRDFLRGAKRNYPHQRRHFKDFREEDAKISFQTGRKNVCPVGSIL